MRPTIHSRPTHAAIDQPAENAGQLRSTSRLCLLTLILFLAYSAFLSAFSRPGFPAELYSSSRLPFLADKPLGEDGFYLLTVAWHLADGDVLMYNLDHRTTGIQPLYALVLGGVAWLVKACGGDRWTFLRLVILLGAVNLVIFARLSGAVAAGLVAEKNLQSSVASVTTLLTVASFGLFRIFTYGLETGFYLILLTLLLKFQLSRPEGVHFSVREALAFGSLSGLAGLARLDFTVILFVALILLWRSGTLSFWNVLTIGGTTTAFICPWLIVVHQITGRFFPSSGGAQASLVDLDDFLSRALNLGMALVDLLTPWGYTGQRIGLTIAALSSLLIFLVWTRAWKQAHLLRSCRLTRAWLTAFLVLAAVYFAFFWATFFYPRYTSPVLVIVLPWLGILAAKRLSESSALVQTALLLCPLISFAAFATMSLHRGTVGNPHSVTAGFVASKIPAEYRVGAFQSGVVGFFNPNVINLDGKIDAEALEFSRRGRIEDYIDLERIDILVDWRDWIHSALPVQYLEENWVECREPIGNLASLCLMRKGVAPF